MFFFQRSNCLDQWLAARAAVNNVEQFLSPINGLTIQYIYIYIYNMHTYTYTRTYIFSSLVSQTS